ncbi:NAD(P)-binding domain-containing protein [Psychromonas sp. GE-S-Ul-11]|uniref:NAD(P)-binding domain-containing protein n=1 Tax=Psychromonas sp. GE-S-Ul-11 TaxID=3241170 RepID=UPI00390CB9EA
MINNKTVSILGSGWLGEPLANHLAQAGYEVGLSTRTPTKVSTLKKTRVTPHIIDIEALQGNVKDFLQAQTLIINITCKALPAFEKLAEEIAKSPIQQVLFISSTSVYPNDAGLCSESDQLTSETNLRKIEKCFTDNIGFECTVLRLAGLIGRKRHPGRFFASGKSIKDGFGKVNLIHQADCIKLIETILTQQAWGEIFNGCADNHPTKKDYYTEMALSLGLPKPDYIIAENSATKVISNEKVKRTLGYQFIYPNILDVSC